jgi:hypothetical protein
MTKVPTNLKDHNLLEYNIAITKKKIPHYLLPIGHTKEQKQHSAKMKEYLEAKFNTIEPKARDGSKTPGRVRTAVSKFKTSKIDPVVVRKSIIKSASKNVLMHQRSTNISSSENAMSNGGSSNRGGGLPGQKRASCFN